MDRDELRKLLDDVRHVEVAVVGDFCLDAYWIVDPSRAERSLETGKLTQPVREQRYSLGGAGNVVSNLAATGCGKVRVFGVVGDDPWGYELRRRLGELGVDATGLLTQTGKWDSLVYTKPHVGGDELSRFDFGNFNVLADATADAVLAALAACLPTVSVVIVNEQVEQGLHSAHFRAGLRALMARHPDTRFIVDSRHYSDAYAGALLKLNAAEAATLAGMKRPPGTLVMRQDAVQAAEALFSRSGQPVFVTRSDRGILVRDADGLHEIPGIQIVGRTDPVGAGDSTLAGIALGLAAGRSPADAARLGNFVASVTVRKLKQTGTATPAEVMAVGADPDYVYRPNWRRIRARRGCCLTQSLRW